MYKKKPLVSVIITNFNGMDYLEKCLMSVKKTKYPKFEVFLIDDGSTDRSVDFVKKNFKWVRIIKNEKNIGPIKSRNRGIKLSRGSLIAFLDNDTVVTPEWLSELVNVIERDEKIGVCACKVKLYSEKGKINSAGMGCDIFGFAFSRGLVARNVYERDVGQYDKEEEIFAAYAAAMLARRDVLKKVGMLNENLGMYYEEVELCWKIRLAGYKIIYVPCSIVYHRMTGAKSKFKPKMKFYTERNRLRTMLQNYSLLSLIWILPIYFILKIFESILYIVFGKFNDGLSMMHGIFDVVVGLPNVLRDRKFVQSIRKSSDSEIIEHMVIGSEEFSRFFRGYGKTVLK